MLKFAVSKPTKRIHRQEVDSDNIRRKRVVGVRFFSIKTIWIIFIVFALVYGTTLLLRNTVLAHKYFITRVMYDSGDILWYDDPYLYKLVNARVKGENYYAINIYHSKILNDVKNNFPIIQNFSVKYISSNTVSIKLTFNPLNLVIRNQDQKYGVYNGNLFALTSGNKIANGIQILDLPEYLSGMTTLSGLFFRQSASELIQQIQLIYQGFPGLQRIEYLPGGERTIVYTDGKKFYINNLLDIANQVRDYNLLKKYYKEYSLLKEIDLGSLEKNKIIVHK